MVLMQLYALAEDVLYQRFPSWRGDIRPAQEALLGDGRSCYFALRLGFRLLRWLWCLALSQQHRVPLCLGKLGSLLLCSLLLCLCLMACLLSRVYEDPVFPSGYSPENERREQHCHEQECRVEELAAVDEESRQEHLQSVVE